MDNKTYLAQAHAANQAEWKSADARKGIKNNVNMIYAKHSVKNNYNNADGAGDEKMKHDIIMSEIAKLIVFRKDDVVALLKNYGLEVSGTPSEGKMAKYVSHGINKSEKFSQDLTRLIAKNSNMNMFAADAKTPTTSNINYNEVLKDTSGLIAGLGDLFGGKKKAKADASKNKAEADKLRAQAALEKARAEAALKGAIKGVNKGKDTSDNIGLYIGIAAGVIVIAGVAVWYFKFRK